MEDSFLHLRTSQSYLNCSIHPVVLFDILDHFIRRTDGQRVIGTLTGVLSEGYVEIKNCFPVPHTEGEQVGVDMEFHHNQFELHKRVSPKEVIVGWYATGSEINEASLMLHDFYWREISHSPIHLIVDTNLTNYSMSIKAYTSTNITFNDKALGSQFLPIPLELQTFDAEKIGVEMLMRGKLNVNGVQPLVSDLDSLESSVQKLLSMLQTASTYVHSSLKGEVQPNNTIGRLLADSLSSLPKIEPQSLEKMFNNSVQDLLLVVYLANLTRTQLALAEKLQKSI
jgi:translation initiation factor 3 subunit F